MRTNLASVIAMGVSLKPEHLKRYKDFAWLLWKYGRGDLVRRAGLSDLMPEVEDDGRGDPPAEAEQLAADVESLGPTCIKLGQLLSTRDDIGPPAYRRAPLEGVSFHRRGAARGRLDRAGAPREAAGWARSGAQGAASRHPRTGRERPRGDVRDSALPRRAHRVRAPLRARADVRPVREVARPRARFPPGSGAPDGAGAQPRRDRGDLRTGAGARLQRPAGADDGVRRRHENHVAQPARAHPARRRASPRRALPGVPQADAARRPVPRRSASGQRVRREWEDRAHRPRHGGAPLAGIAGPAAAAALSRGALAGAAVALKQLAQTHARRRTPILDGFPENGFQVKVDALDEPR